MIGTARSFAKLGIAVSSLWLTALVVALPDLSAAPPEVRTNSETATLTYPVIGVRRIKRKLDEIVLPEVHFDGVSLAEVVKRLSDEAKRFDPEKKGLNFLIFDPVPPAPVLDVSGNPVPAGQSVSLGEGLIQVRQPLTGLTLRHALDVICKSAEVPMQFGVEEYAVTFFPRAPAAGVFGRTLRVNPNTFQQGLPGVVGNPVPGVTVGGNAPVGGRTGL